MCMQMYLRVSTSINLITTSTVTTVLFHYCCIKSWRFSTHHVVVFFPLLFYLNSVAVVIVVVDVLYSFRLATRSANKCMLMTSMLATTTFKKNKIK